MPFVRCPTPADLAPVLADLTTRKGDALLLFFGAEDPVTGESWCPDCVTADPVLRRTIAQQRPDLTVYECPVGQRSDWKNKPEHPYRLHPLTKVARIPTLIRIAAGQEIGRLVEADCATPANVTAFIR